MKTEFSSCRNLTSVKMKIFIFSLLFLFSLVSYCQGERTCTPAHPCKNGGVCNFATGICNCTQGFTGPLCGFQNGCHPPCEDGQLCLLINQTYQCIDDIFCTTVADIAIALDCSSSISVPEFKLMVQTVKIIVDHFDFGANAVRFAVFGFNDFISDKVIFFNSNLNKTSFEKDLDELAAAHPEGGTRTDKALKFFRTQIFQPNNGDRPDVPNVAIILTDGYSNKPNYTKMEIDIFENLDILRMVVGIGNDVNEDELDLIASEPEYVLRTNFTSLTEIFKPLTITICNMTNCCNRTECKNNGTCKTFMNTCFCECPCPYYGILCDKKCDIRGDIMIALDDSGSITPFKFNKMIDAVLHFIMSVDITNGKVRIGIITFALDVFVHYDLDFFQNKLTMLFVTNLLRFQYRGGPTFSHKALRYLREHSFTPQRGDRPNYPNYVLFFTDGKSRFPWKTKKYALMLHCKATVYGIGILPGVNVNELKMIVSYPKQNHILVMPPNKVNISMNEAVDHVCHDLKPRPPCMKCHRRCKCYPGMKCCKGCCRDTCTLLS